MSYRAPFVVPAIKKHTATVIMAHGLGDSGAGWVGLAQNWRRRNKFEEVSFIFPNAPMIPITVNMGMTMPGWYDIAHLGQDMDFEEAQRNQDEPGILKSRDYFNTLIKEEIDKGIEPSRIILGGFSQGGAMSLFTGITSPYKLGGIFGLSCYLLLSTKLKEFSPPGGELPNAKTPFFVAHGYEDPVVKYEFGDMTQKRLKGMGFDVEFHSYRGLGHSADPQEIEDLETFMAKVLPPTASDESAGL
ncbi:phospholipase, putative [Talaromyces stipitatus ATCC 10500]|uniref:Acyl-protein thioesterase 1 n=1 Tax=Talaromyces stipitatus (strain ATCC 10500 / CBS 375.48 / QM 6759 / NRRL 1006) TaxID=441959 RepID=B8MKK9_TALSN|nr:phospholipase, putative [Talaromyces stipitatus ATCC 10500]EED15364.1 phospholipase, putative [Talaromyces stipitatus ATCC 10500]